MKSKAKENDVSSLLWKTPYALRWVRRRAGPLLITGLELHEETWARLSREEASGKELTGTGGINYNKNMLGPTGAQTAREEGNRSPAPVIDRPSVRCSKNQTITYKNTVLLSWRTPWLIQRHTTLCSSERSLSMDSWVSFHMYPFCLVYLDFLLFLKYINKWIFKKERKKH